MSVVFAECTSTSYLFSCSFMQVIRQTNPVKAAVKAGQLEKIANARVTARPIIWRDYSHEKFGVIALADLLSLFTIPFISVVFISAIRFPLDLVHWHLSGRPIDTWRHRQTTSRTRVHIISLFHHQYSRRQHRISRPRLSVIFCQVSSSGYLAHRSGIDRLQ